MQQLHQQAEPCHLILVGIDRFSYNRHMNTSADVSKLYQFMLNVEFCFSRCGGVEGSLHLTEPSMNRLNQTESATFSILPCWAFFGDS
jgi:hypothetical protein